MTKTCEHPHCDNIFEITRKHPNKKFCSKECYRNSTIKKRCENSFCQKEYDCLHIKNNIQKYCSKGCFDMLRNTTSHFDSEGNVIEKLCSKCGNWKKPTEFKPCSKRRTGIYSSCYTCERKIQKKLRYGVSDEYLEMLEKAHCVVCKSRENLCIDHCHTTNINRGILCDGCNTSLGRLEEDPERIRRLAKYADYCQKLKKEHKDEA